jgi:hypothetical protein
MNHREHRESERRREQEGNRNHGYTRMNTDEEKGKSE